MLTFKMLENNTALVKINGVCYHLTDSEVDYAYYQAYELVEYNHTGHATVKLGAKWFNLTNTEWQELFNKTEQYLQVQFSATEEKPIHH